MVIDPEVHWVPDPWTALDTELAAAPLGLGPRALVVGRPGGPAFRPSELARLTHLAGIIATVLGSQGYGCGPPVGAGARLGRAPRCGPSSPSATDEIIAAVRAEVPDYARPLTGRFGTRITEGVSVALDQFVDLLGVDAAPGDLRVYRALGQLEHREGRTLAALQSAYQVGTRTAWRRLGGRPDARRHCLPEVIFALAEALFTYVEQLGAASVAGWAYEDARNAGSRADAPARPRRAARPAPARAPPPRSSGWPRPPAGGCRPGWPRWSSTTPWRSRPGCPGRSGRTWTPSGSRWSRCRSAPSRPRPAGGPGARWRCATGPRARAGGRAGAGVPVGRAGAGGMAAARGGAAAARARRPAWSARTSTCWRCCWPPSRSWPPTCANARWPRCAPCRPGRRRAASRRCGPGSTRTATCPRRRPRPARAPADRALPAGRRCARCSGTRWTTRRRGWSWRSRCG